MAENQVPTKSKRDQFGERLKKKYPDREYADDEALFGQIDEDYANYDDQINQYQEREGRITDLFSTNPSAAHFFIDMAKGNDPWIGTIERLGIDGVTDLLNDPSKREQYVEANKRYLERVAKEKELEAEYNKNMQEVTLPMLDRLKQERGIDDETIDEAWTFLHKMADEVILGNFTEETMNMALNAINHDADVANARTEGNVAGRNAKIKETLRKPQSGDGTPTLAGSNNTPTSQRRRPMNIFDYADAAK